MFKKIVHPCNVPGWDGKNHPMFCKIEIDDKGTLSISGVIGPRKSGNAFGGCGQIDMEFDHLNKAHNDRRYTDPIKASDLTFMKGWDQATWYKFLAIWADWHLNDMTAGCEHFTEDTQKELTLTPLRPGPEYHKARRAAEEGKLTPAEYQKYSKNVQIMEPAWLGSESPKDSSLWSEAVKELIAADWLQIDKVEIKTAGWVDYREHPEGLLCRPCPVCGYKYGTAWLKRDLPAEVVTFLQSLPDTDVQPAWV